MRRLPLRRRLRRALASPGRLRAPLGEELDRALERERLDVVAAPQARVRLAVGDVRAEAAVLDDDRLAADGVRAELAQRRRAPAAAAPLLRLRESASASSSVIVRSCSSDSSERVSLPFLRYGP